MSQPGPREAVGAEVGILRAGALQGVHRLQVARQNRGALAAELARRFSTIHYAGSA
jgi:hypothetical protein